MNARNSVEASLDGGLDGSGAQRLDQTEVMSHTRIVYVAIAIGINIMQDAAQQVICVFES